MRKNNRRGVTLILVAALMVGMLTFLAFVFDFSRIYAQKNELQTAADAASLAGVIELLSQPDSVVNSAISIGQRNQVLKKTITVFPGDVECGTWNDAAATYAPSGAPCAITDNAVRAATRDSANWVFPVLVGATGKQLTTSAIAWAAFVGRTSCVKPIAMRYEMLTQTLDPTNPDPLRDLTPYDLQQLASLPVASLTFTLHLGTGSPTDPGNYGSLSFPRTQSGMGGPGMESWANNFAGCYDGLLGAGDIVHTQPGVGLGKVREGVIDFCSPPGLTNGRWGNCMDATGTTVGRLMVVPLWYTADMVSGNTSVTIRGLVSFLLDHLTDSGDIIGHFVSVPAGGTVSATPSTLRRIVLVK
jgi:hypothetical protein